MINLQCRIFTSEIDIIEWDWNKFQPHLFINNCYNSCTSVSIWVSPFPKKFKVSNTRAFSLTPWFKSKMKNSSDQEVYILSSKLIAKEPHSGGQFAWHQVQRLVLEPSSKWNHLDHELCLVYQQSYKAQINDCLKHSGLRIFLREWCSVSGRLWLRESAPT